MIDIQSLKAAADCRSVAEYIGMKVCGQFCECVSGLHSETRINHCAIYKDNIHCFSCGFSRDVIGMTQAFYENVLGTPVTFIEACGIVGDACGGRDLFEIDRRPGKPALKFILSSEELNLIGLRPGIQKLYAEDKDLCKKIILDKAAEELKKIEKLKGLLGCSSFEKALLLASEERFQKIEIIRKKVGGSPRLQKMFKL